MKIYMVIQGICPMVTNETHIDIVKNEIFCPDNKFLVIWASQYLLWYNHRFLI